MTPSIAFRAKWIFPVDRPPIANGAITLQGGKITQLGPVSDCDASNVVDLGDVAVIPGLVNAHTHLEFSDLEKPLGDPSLGFPKWIESVVAHRRSDSKPQNKPAAIQVGILESIQAGVVALGEIATTPWTQEVYDSSLQGVVFHEQLGNNPLEANSKTEEIEIRTNTMANPSWTPGISPHAPYSTSLSLFQSLIDLAAKNKTRVAMHLAETLEEVEFIETAKGPFAEMLESMGIPFNRSGPIKTEDYLQRLSSVDALIVHGNFLNVEELELIASFENQHIIFCPRTHKYFRHPEYPLRTMLDLGINVAVGTDSRASNPDLSLFAELQEISDSQPNVRPQEILEMGTLSGAKSLGLASQLGTLEVGKSSQLCVVKTGFTHDPFESLFGPESHCERLIVDNGNNPDQDS